jgi:hypothetical protein
MKTKQKCFIYLIKEQTELLHLGFLCGKGGCILVVIFSLKGQQQGIAEPGTEKQVVIADT